MARAQEPRPSVGGQMAPGVLESAGRARALAENRLLESMRQAGATERGKIQAGAQVRTAQIGASSRQAVAAMQAAVSDRRAAESLRNAEAERKHRVALENLRAQHSSDNVKLTHRLHTEHIEKNILPVIQEAQAMGFIGNMNAINALGENTRALFELTKLNMAGEADKEARDIKYQQMVDSIDKETTIYNTEKAKSLENLRKDPDMVGEPLFDIPAGEPGGWQKAVEKELQRSNITGLTVGMLTPGNEVSNSKLVGTQIRKSDVQGMYRVLTAAERVTGERVNSLKGEGDALFIPEEDITLKWWQTVVPFVGGVKNLQMAKEAIFRGELPKTKITRKGLVYEARPKKERLSKKGKELGVLEKQLLQIQAAKNSLLNLQNVDIPISAGAVGEEAGKKPKVGQVVSDWLNGPMGRLKPLRAAPESSIEEQIDIATRIYKNASMMGGDEIIELFKGDLFKGMPKELIDRLAAKQDAMREAYMTGLGREEPEFGAEEIGAFPWDEGD